MEDILLQIFSEYGIFVTVMSVIVLGLVNVLKIPIKLLTSKITNANLKKWVNTTIIILPFAIAYALCTLCGNYFPQYFLFSWDKVLTVGTSSVALYNLFGDKVIVNLFKNKEAEAVINTLQEITEDKKIDTEDIDAVTNLYKELNK